MAAIGSLASVEEYIARFVDGGEKPTCEYVDGVLTPKAMAGKDHSRVQKNIVVYVSVHHGRQFDTCKRPRGARK
jgi:Uma2 family endonuclease